MAPLDPFTGMPDFRGSADFRGRNILGHSCDSSRSEENFFLYRREGGLKNLHYEIEKK